MKLHYGVFLNNRDKFHFLLCAKYLPISKDIVRYIANNFFNEKIPIVDHYMKPFLKSQEDKDVFEKFKHNQVQKTFAPSGIRDELWYGMIIAFSKAAMSVCLYVHASVFLKQSYLIEKYSEKEERTPIIFSRENWAALDVKCFNGFVNHIFVSKESSLDIRNYFPQKCETVLVFVERDEEEEGYKRIVLRNCEPGSVKMLIKQY